MKRMKLLAAVLFLAGCSDPKDIVLGPEPLKQLSEQGAQIKKLSEEDRKLLAAYLAMDKMRSVFGGNSKSVAGMTIGEVIEEAKKVRENMLAKEAEEKALKEKVMAEQKVISEKISSSVVVAVVDKEVRPKNYEIGRYEDFLSISYAVENKSKKVIRQLKGRVIFKDATGDLVGWLPVNFEEKIAAGTTLKTDTGSGWRVSGITNGDIEKIARTEFSLMTASFEPDAIAFDDGEVIKSPDLN
ncbi:MAG: hypothetical protein PHR16_11870 [Methylovulum sp.]|nr:hypothetical protein [Methylovulum sp.]